MVKLFLLQFSVDEKWKSKKKTKQTYISFLRKYGYLEFRRYTTDFQRLMKREIK